MQYLCDGICTSVTKIIPVVALVVFLYSKTDTCFEAYKVCGFIKFQYRNYSFILHYILFGFMK